MPLWGGYLSENGIINFERLEQLLKVLADEEAEVFEWRAAEEAKFAKKQRRFGKSGGAAAAAAVEDEEESEAATEAETSGSEIVSDAKTPFMPVSDSAIHAEHRDMAMERLGVSPSARHALGTRACARGATCRELCARTAVTWTRCGCVLACARCCRAQVQGAVLL
ncbi:MAG: hypothetical protein EOO65_04025 [Methanosarcinales archaeon]|nr:MAG: hypothetical protein EOO65_04025 [Methanosarcinales archaeon]